MSSYFDDKDTVLRALFASADMAGADLLLDFNVGRASDATKKFWKQYHEWENDLIATVLTAARVKKMPRELAMAIQGRVALRRVFRTSKSTEMDHKEAAALLQMRSSFLSSELHSIFHRVASYGAEKRIRHLVDDPSWMARRAPRS